MIQRLNALKAASRPSKLGKGYAHLQAGKKLSQPAQSAWPFTQTMGRPQRQLKPAGRRAVGDVEPGGAPDIVGTKHLLNSRPDMHVFS